MRFLIIIAIFLMSSCSEPPPKTSENKPQESTQSNGLGEQMASAAVGGFAAGAGAAVGHQAANAMIHKYQSRKRAARIQSYRSGRR